MKDDDGEERLLHREQVEQQQQVRTEGTGTILLQHTNITQQKHTARRQELTALSASFTAFSRARKTKKKRHTLTQDVTATTHAIVSTHTEPKSEGITANSGLESSTVPPGEAVALGSTGGGGMVSFFF